MKIYRDGPALAALIADSSQQELGALMHAQLVKLAEYDIEPHEIAHAVVIEEGDMLVDLEKLVGRSLSGNLLIDPAPWDAFEAHQHWYLLIFIISDDGFGYLVFVPRNESNALAGLCNTYASITKP